MKDWQITSEIGSLVLGGTDTTTVVLSYTLWELAKQSEWKGILKELKDSNIEFEEGFCEV
jgi:cytochrome P450